MKVKEMIRQTCRLDPNRDYNIELINGQTWVFFHASWSWLDWVRDFIFIPIRISKGVWMHMGYLFEAEDIVDQLVHDLGHATNIVFAGYSRGAAVALILSPLPNVSKVYIMGCPRTFVGKNSLNKQKDKVVEIIYGNDLVTYLPPFFSKIKYGKTIKIPSESKGWFKCIKDHGNYIDCEEDV